MTSSARFLRKLATQQKKAARRGCSQAKKEGRAVASARAALIKSQEAKKARALCETLDRVALEAEGVYLRARPPVSERERQKRIKASERRQFTERDAIAAVVAHTGHTEAVARIAVKSAMRSRGLPRGAQRWRVVAERAAERIDDAWRTFLLAEERAAEKAFRTRGGASSPKKKRAARRNWYDEQEERDKRQRRERGARIQPVIEDELVVVMDDVPF